MLQNAKTAVVTGGHSGIGFELSRMLLASDWNLVLLRRKGSGERAVDSLRAQSSVARVETVDADLADQDQIAAAVNAIEARHTAIGALFNSAGVLLDGRVESRHGNEMHFQVNTLAPYLTMQLLRKTLERAGQAIVVNVSSDAANQTGSLQIGSLRNPTNRKKLFGPYGQSKLALTTLTNALAPGFMAMGVSLRSVCPGFNKTPMTAGEGMPGAIRLLRPLFASSPRKGASAVFSATFSEKFAGQSGIFIVGGKVNEKAADARNPQVQSKLLALCRELTGV